MTQITKLYGGIDPGTSNGATVFLDQDKNIIEWQKFEDVYDQSNFIRRIRSEYSCPILVSLEIPGYHPIWSKVAFRELGKNEGHHQGILAATDVSYRFVAPKDWQKKILGGLNKTDKNVARLFVNRLYPDLKAPKASGVWDAICIALSGM